MPLGAATSDRVYVNGCVLYVGGKVAGGSGPMLVIVHSASVDPSPWVPSSPSSLSRVAQRTATLKENSLSLLLFGLPLTFINHL